MYGNLNSGLYESDWTKRSQFSSLLNANLETDWQNQAGAGLKLGGDYFFKLSHSTFNYFFIGFELQSYGRLPKSTTFGNSGFASNDYATGLGVADLKFGFVVWDESNFRIKPKLVLSGTNQVIEENYFGQLRSIIGSTIVNGVTFGSTKSTSLADTSMLGSAFEYDVNDKLTLYTDLYILSPFLYQVNGKYDTKMVGFLALFPSTGATGSSLAYGSSSGTYSISGGKIELGGSYSVSNDLKLLFSISSTAYLTKFSNGIAFSILNAQVGNTGSTSLDFFASTIGERILNSQSQTLTIVNINLGLSKDLVF